MVKVVQVSTGQLNGRVQSMSDICCYDDNGQLCVLEHVEPTYSPYYTGQTASGRTYVGTNTNGNWWVGRDDDNDNNSFQTILITSPHSVMPQPLPVVQRCKYCGVKFHPDDRLCESCGAPL